VVLESTVQLHELLRVADVLLLAPLVEPDETNMLLALGMSLGLAMVAPRESTDSVETMLRYSSEASMVAAVDSVITNVSLRASLGRRARANAVTWHDIRSRVEQLLALTKPIER
jgi:glycosyltransferase involved in cell wall biosynthesis